MLEFVWLIKRLSKKVFKVHIRQIFVNFFKIIFGILHDKQVDVTTSISLVWLQRPISFSLPDMITQIFTYTGVNY